MFYAIINMQSINDSLCLSGWDGKGSLKRPVVKKITKMIVAGTTAKMTQRKGLE